MDALLDAGNALLDFLYPPKCYLCGTIGAYLCESCIDAWPRPEDPRCPQCAHPLDIGGCQWCGTGMAPLTGAAFPFMFEEGVREVVHLLKYSARRRLAAPMADQMARSFWDSPALRQCDVIVPVGLHPKRHAKRGYNQSEWLSAELGILLGMQVRCWSSRERDTRPQVGLSRQDRAANVASAFSATPEANGHHILLVDDVSTTGATAREAARALRRAGAASIGLLTFARDV